MSEAGAGQAESLRQASGWRHTFFTTPSLFLRPPRVAEAIVPPLRKARSMKAAKLIHLAVFLGVPLAAAAALVLARTGSTLLQSGAYVFSALSGIDIDVDLLSGDNIAQAVRSGAKDLTEPSPKRIFDTRASVVTIQGDDDAHDVDTDAEEVDEETGFKAKPIEASPLYEHYDTMSCEQLKTIVTEIHMAQHSVSPDMIEENDFDTEEIERHLAVINNVRAGKLLGGDKACNF